MTVPCPESVRTLHFIETSGLAQACAQRTAAEQSWIAAHGFKAERGRCLALPDPQGGAPRAVWVGTGGEPVDLGLALGLPDRLPAGDYVLAEAADLTVAKTVALGFALGAYRFARYKKLDPAAARFWAPPSVDTVAIGCLARADALARDLINTPAQDMGPVQLAAAVAAVAAQHGADYHEVVGEALQTEGYPAIHAVGRSGAQSPRLVTLSAGTQGPLIAIVGKGVCFDTGGLDLKPASGMALMKKDMGGAAVALALADLVLGARWPVRLLLVIPAVENGVGPDAYRPGDVLATRKGLTVEVTNTDAEGRLVLADALVRAAEAAPDVLIDFATLTGAARVALGPELPAAYGSDPALVAALAAIGAVTADPLWPMPLWAGYEDELGSRVADLQNASASGFAGSITAALFLRRFVPPTLPWLHLDLYGWNPKERPGRPVGAEAQTLRAVFEWLRIRYAGA